MLSKTVLQALSFGMLASNVAGIQFINAVWSTTAFQTISGPGGGGESSHGSGFALIDEDGKTIWEAQYPGGYAPCQRNEHSFTLSGGCLADGQQFEFACSSKFDGSPEHCKVLDSNGHIQAESDGHEDTKFIGISIGMDGTCGASFALPHDVHCAPDSKGFNVS